MTRADQMKAKAAKLAARNATQEVRTSAPTEATENVRVKPVRLTVDVTPADHAALNRLCLLVAEEIGVARVYGQEMVRSLVGVMLTDSALQARVIADVAQRRRDR